LSIKKFPVVATSDIAAAAGLALVAGGALAVVVAGEIAAVAGDIAGAAGLVTAAGAFGAAAAGLVSDVAGGGGGDWPKEVNTKVTELRLAISSVFIGLIGKFFFRLELRLPLSSKRQLRVQQNFRVWLFNVLDLNGTTKVISYHLIHWAVA
jgi:hypothetical protein